jgi:hypothetical protein
MKEKQVLLKCDIGTGLLLDVGAGFNCGILRSLYDGL